MKQQEVADLKIYIHLMDTFSNGLLFETGYYLFLNRIYINENFHFLRK